MARYAGTSDRLVVCFSGVGTERHEAPPFELLNSATVGGRHSALFVSDPTRSWLNAPNLLATILKQVKDAQRAFGTSKTVAIGNSMGGFMALELSRHIELVSVLALAPQYSVDPAVVPEETRWEFFRKMITSFEVPCIADLPEDRGIYYVVNGGTVDEHMHWHRFPVQTNLKHYIMPRRNHKLASAIKAEGMLKQVVQEAVENRSAQLGKTLRGLGAIKRQDLLPTDLPKLPHQACL